MRKSMIAVATSVAIAAGMTGASMGPAEAKESTSKAHKRPSWAPYGTKPCKVEDADGPCYWDAGSSGNGRGTSFYVIPLNRKTKSYTYPFAHKYDEVTPRDY